ncbi:MAG TPA: cupin domain-containing protein [Stellaceae bacterium]|nr:cupin domain-containing protein [Stellaceae bacterium]
MQTVATASKAPAPDKSTMKVAVTRKNDANFVPGRRAFFRYRDLGVTGATNGRMRAQLTSATAGMSEPTGWHYHVCEAQFVYLLSGWVELEFEDSGAVRLEAGDSVLIPGGTRHQEMRTSDDFEIIEFSVPAEMATVSCDPPQR